MAPQSAIKLNRIGLASLAVMGQNLALNIAEKGFPISVYNVTTSKVDETIERAKAEGDLPLFRFHDPESFVQSLQKTRVKIVHNGIEYGDMHLIAEAYDVLKTVGKLSNEELKDVFSEWTKGELQSFLFEITADMFGIKGDKGDGYLVDKVLDKTRMKGTGKWTIQQAAECFSLVYHFVQLL